MGRWGPEARALNEQKGGVRTATSCAPTSRPTPIRSTRPSPPCFRSKLAARHRHGACGTIGFDAWPARSGGSASPTPNAPDHQWHSRARDVDDDSVDPSVAYSCPSCAFGAWFMRLRWRSGGRTSLPPAPAYQQLLIKPVTVTPTRIELCRGVRQVGCCLAGWIDRDSPLTSASHELM